MHAVEPMDIKPLSSKDLVTAATLTRADLDLILATASASKRDIQPYRRALDGLAVAMLFEKPSLRTRCTFEVGAARLGAHALYYDHQFERIGQRESVKDYAMNLERWVHAIVLRTYSQKTIEEMARYARVPVINALSDADHPCQALADALTLRERFGRFDGLTVSYIGDGNNVCVSLMHVLTKLGANMRAITPKGFEPPADAAAEAREFARTHGGTLTLTSDPGAVAGSQAVYTDTWVSMHQEDQADAREKLFVPYRVDEATMARAGSGSVFMHCLPAHRGEEVTDEVIDSPASLVYEQAENRLHAQNAVLLHTVGARKR